MEDRKMSGTRISSLLGKITVFVVICCCSLPAQAKYGGGTGGPNDPYLIFDANQMNAIGADSNNWDKHFKLMADVDLGSYTGTAFNIIGYRVSSSDNKPFTGVFDGSGQTISNFTYASTGRSSIGLFGYVDDPNAEIKNLGLIGPNVDAGTGGGVGSLVGSLHSGTITNCYVEGGSVAGANYVGGLVGYNDYGCSITNCYSTGSATAEQFVGGLVGVNNGSISNCYSTGDVSGTGNSVGGLVGYNWGTITNCYSVGDVSGEWFVSGLVGRNRYGAITNCYSTGSVTAEQFVGGLVGYNNNYGTISNCYSSGTVSGDERVGGLVGENDGTVSASFWDIQTTQQATSAGGTGKTTAQMQDANTFLDAAWDFVGEFANGSSDEWAEPAVGGYMVLWWQLSPLPVLPTFSGGMGTADDPYLLSTSEDLNHIGHNPRLMQAHFKLISDIDLTGINFYIIGNYAFPFTGVFDGNGHTISNFTYGANGVNHVGLFGYVSGEIKDLGLIDPDVDAGTGDYVGSLVGYLKDETITGCYAEDGSVAGDYFVGGLVGFNSYRSTITNCYATGSVSGYKYVGGLVGQNYYGPITNGTISNCYSTSSVAGVWYVGGLVGYNWGTITSCYAAGSVSGEDYVGGLVGINSDTIINSYSTGSVSGYARVGGLVGQNGKWGWWWWVPGKIVNSYSSGHVVGEYQGGLVGYSGGEVAGVMDSFWDIQTSGLTTSAGGTGKTTAEMQTRSTFTDAGWDFTTPVWTIDEGVDYPRLWWETSPLLHAEPEITLWTTNTIIWDPVPGANDYYAECAEDANFTSILSNTGWITETSYTFTGLELGQRYWYSVKARNSAGVESQWSDVESSLQGTLADAVDAMLDPDTLKNKNMKNALLNKINAVQKMLDAGRYEEALNKLQNDILQKTDGCAETGRPDKNDWIITCEGQSVVYPLVIETIEHVTGLMNQ